MRWEHQLLRIGEYLLGRACRRLPSEIRDERYRGARNYPPFSVIPISGSPRTAHSACCATRPTPSAGPL
jgi:hypothetical protein